MIVRLAVVKTAGVALIVVSGLSSATPAPAQSPRVLFRDTTGVTSTVLASAPRGYATVPEGVLRELGWSLESTEGGSVARMPEAGELVLAAESPFVVWQNQVIQLADAPFRVDGVLHVPIQLLVDFLPAYLPRRYAFDSQDQRLTILGGDGGAYAVEPDPAASGRPAPGAAPDTGAPSAGQPADEIRVVIIDPGHGGIDPGTRGPGGSREKTIVLAVGLALAEALSDDPGLEVHLMRDRDVLVPIWERGERATALKADRPGVFISLHVNASPGSSAVRGFESYFLADARTEHARRIAAVENASASVSGASERATADPDLDFILKELRTFDHEHWSALFAEIVQAELDPVHPGPNRGVKQAPLAVLTNALMPSVLVELGYVTNRQEERLLSDPEFQGRAAESLAAAVRRFFERYPTARAGGMGGRG